MESEFTCHNCLNIKPIEKRLRCSKCKLRTYCSRECQKEDWKKEHKNRCIPVSDATMCNLKTIQKMNSIFLTIIEHPATQVWLDKTLGTGESILFIQYRGTNEQLSDDYLIRTNLAFSVVKLVDEKLLKPECKKNLVFYSSIVDRKHALEQTWISIKSGDKPIPYTYVMSSNIDGTYPPLHNSFNLIPNNQPESVANDSIQEKSVDSSSSS